MRDIIEVANAADLIVNGYIKVLNLNNPIKAVLLDGEVLQSFL